ncbi:Oxalate-formate antiporter [Streptococcus sp. ZB199]|nr:Oxalate-formate antiporter [Streptococcus sp. ZB199]
MKETFNRWQVLAASTAILLCTGAVYSFSVFAGPLSSSTGWSMSEIMLAFAINSAIGPIPMILGGYLVDKGYVKWTIALGALLFASGFYLTGYASSPAMLYLTYGLMAGLGQGFAYSGALSNSLRLFPDKRGLASGILTGGMGLLQLSRHQLQVVSFKTRCLLCFSNNRTSLYCCYYLCNFLHQSSPKWLPTCRLESSSTN